MAIKTFKKTYTNDKDLDAVQSNVQVVLDQITGFLPLGGCKIGPVAVAASPATTAIEHKLGRQPQGFWVIDKTAPGDIYRVSWDSKFLTLQSSSATTIQLWIF